MDPSIWWSIAIILTLLCLSAFFSGSETALTAVNRASMHRMAAQGSKGAKTALDLTDDNERLIGAILLGNNLVNILAASLATAAFTMLFGESGVAWATLVMTLLVLIFAEVLPKTYAITNPETAAVRVAPIIRVLVRVLAPIVRTIQLIVRSALGILGVSTDPDAHVMAPAEQIKGTIDLHHSEGSVDKIDRDRLLAALDLKDREVAEVMRHRSDIQSISADEPPEDILAFCLESPHTRIPLWRGEPENIIGVLHAKDLLRAEYKLVRQASDPEAALKSLELMSVAMKPWFVPDTRPLDDLLRAFLRRKTHFALVVDEYGVLQGLVTLEDIIEEIVGDITDEHDVDAEGLIREADGAFVMPGAMTIRDLNRALDWELPDEEATTVAGLMIHEAQTIPTEGQVFAFHGIRFEVLERTRHQITRLRLRPLMRTSALAKAP
ncbi:MAG: HlyC/CorC family transporter [Pseudomonadota bacterium]